MTDTNRKRAEEKLRETEAIRQSEERLRPIFETSPIGIVITSPETDKRLYINQAMVELLGAESADQVLEQELVATFADPEDLKRLRSSTGDDFITEIEIERKRLDGTRWWCLMNRRPIEYEGQKAVLGWHYDISERKEAEQKIKRINEELEQRVEERTQELRKSDILFSAAFDQNAVGMAIRDVGPRESRWLRVNQKFCDIFGYTREEMLQLTSIDVSPPEEQHIAIKFNEQLLRGEIGSYSREKRYVRKDGQIFWANIWLSPILGPDGYPTQLIQVIQDITERKRAEEALRESDARLRAVFDNTPVCLNLKDTEGRYILLNKPYEEWLGRPAEEIIGKKASEFLKHEAEVKILTQAERQVLETGEVVEREVSVPRPNGTVYDRILIKFPVKSADGSIAAIGTVAVDITERKRAEAALRESEERFRFAFENAPIGVALITPEGNRFKVNKALADFLGYSVEELTDTTMKSTAADLDDLDKSLRLRQRVLDGEITTYRNERRYRHKQGHVVWGEVSGSLFRNEDGEPEHFIAHTIDITERKRAEEKLRHVARHDELTGLPNRREFIDLLERTVTLARRGGRFSAVHVIGLDQFKAINETHGREAGNELLHVIAQRLRACARTTDVVARLGGDEFGVIQVEPDSEDGVAVFAQKLLDCMDEPFDIGGSAINCSATVGAAVFPNDTKNSKDLLLSAYIALDHGKKEGGSIFQFFVARMNEIIRHRRRVEEDLRNAVERNEIEVYFQPKLELSTSRLVGMEALVRWTHPEMGFLLPGDFIPIAERSRQIIPLGEWVLSEASRQTQAWIDAGYGPLRLAVNLSAVQLHDGGLINGIRRNLNDTGLAPSCLELEITETVAMYDAEKAINVFTAISDLGVSLSIDDFGTGYSSLSYLKSFPVKWIKIDKAFVDDIDTPGNSGAIARAVITLGHSFDMQITAEGVETEEQLIFLHGLGCDEMQGYLFSKPLPAHDFGVFLESYDAARFAAIAGKARAVY